MAGNERVRDLVDRWEQLRQVGVAATAEELCGDCPDLVDEMREWVSALKATDWLCDAETGSETDTAAARGEPAAQPPKEPFQQFTIGEYTVLGEIGHGGMGSVYRARHRMMDRLVAIKILPAAVVASPEMVERFHREMQAVARLSHPNIVTAYDAGQCDGTHFLAMELIDGVDLSRQVREHGPLAVADAVNYILQAAQGLAYVHAAGMIHRDIKPSNLLLDKGGRIKVIDLGLARFDRGARCGESGEAVAELTKSGAVFGTVAYMAPEQASGRNRVDQRADVYSLGCTLCFLLTGQPVFPGEGELEQLLAHRERAAPSLAALRGDVPGELDRLFQRMVAKKPEDRCQSMREVIDALQAVTAPCQGTGGPAPTTPNPGGENAMVTRTFDPYYKWLGIRPEDQPPNHYRLLGIEPFETDVEVIEDAAMQRIAHVRSYQLGPHSGVSQKILNELAGAKACLLDRQKKAAYDAELRQRQSERATLAQRKGLRSATVVETASAASAPTPPPARVTRPPVAKAAPAAAVTAAPARAYPQRWKILFATIAVGLGGLLVVAAILVKIKTSQGILVVEVDQPNATIMVDGEKVTVTSPATKEVAEVRLKDGKYGVSVAKSGFQTTTPREIVIKAGQREEIKIHMEPLAAVAKTTPSASAATAVNAAQQSKPAEGVLVLEIDQPQAVVAVAGQQKATLTSAAVAEAAEVRLKDGKYVLTVAKSGFKTYQDEIVMRSGERQRIKIHLEPDPGQKYVDSQLPQAKAGNWWAEYCLWEAYQKGAHDVQPNPDEARKWLAELVKGVHLATFRPVKGFAPRTPMEFLNQFSEHSNLRSGDKRIGGASFFRTRVKDGGLIGSFLTEYPDQMRAAVAANPSLELVSIEKLTPEMFVPYEASRQESLEPAQGAPGVAPLVVGTEPPANATDVDPNLTQISATFSKAMRDKSWSWCTGDEGQYPGNSGQGQAGPHYEKDGRTCVLPVNLAPGQTYAVWLNSGQYRGFADVEGHPAVPYLLVFHTAGAPRPLLSSALRAAYEQKLPESLRRYRDWSDNLDAFQDALRVEEIAPGQKAAKEAQWLDELRSQEGRAVIPAINGLAKLQSGKAVPGLLRIATDPRQKDNRDRWMAVRALGLIGDDSAVPKLVHLTYHYNSNVRFWAQISLARLTGQSFGRDVQAWADWWAATGRKPAISTARVTWASRPEWADPNQQIEQDQKMLERVKAGGNGRPAAGRGFAAGSATEPKIIEYTIGPKFFHSGDSVTITEVKATSPDLKTGDKVIVKGHYTLASKPGASLCLFATATKGSGRSEIRPEQKIGVTKGQGEFELSETLDCDGYLHVTFYAVAEGKPFGGSYFGTAKQMKEIEHWDLRSRYTARQGNNRISPQ